MRKLHKIVLLLLFLSSLNIAEEMDWKREFTISSKKKFSINEPLKFSINMGSKEGFIYLVYVDNKGGTSVLYPHKSTKQKKKVGQLKFPKDFGGKDIHTTKDCKGCKEEKTTIFVLLSDDPIENIQNMTQQDIVSIESKQKNKNRDISLNKSKTILVNKVDLYVE
ncbi:MAG TPA: hypothetical protein ENK66_05810 [Arcobacter sp.]|nr:hypothetical protein [Arcobacter sp.]